MAYQIFISHVWRRQNDYYQGLIRLLDQAQRFGFKDLSVPRIRYLDGEAEPVKEQILAVLRTADVVLVVNTPVVSRSSYVQEELNEAEKYGIPIIAINPPKRHGSMSGSQFPAILKARKALWTTKSIVEAIREETKTRRRIEAVSPKFATEVPYESVSDARSEEEPLSPAEFAEVRGDDEQSTGDVAPAPLPQGESPKDVLFQPKEDFSALPISRRSWFAKLFVRHH